MIKIVISVFTVLLFAGGCSSVKNTMQKGKVQILKAEFKKWAHSPVQNSSIPEKGIDLYVTVQHWPQNAVPVYIIYENRKSFKPLIADSGGKTTTITARIIKLSTVLTGKKAKTDLSDCLVYTTAEGDTSFVKIKEWRERN